jgi:hypothetical protein
MKLKEILVIQLFKTSENECKNVPGRSCKSTNRTCECPK